ncbi:MAG TPA: DUF2334 domain-containing protein [Terriglobales bacterium]|nr:DUF2334 domain-containing protein [Terriglobales bacterium]
MPGWLDPVREALDALLHPVVFFFRDDDAGWEDERLFQLTDVFAKHDLPLDLAAIPNALKTPTARELCRRMEAAGGKLRVHQHGYAHINHEKEGRKCEFGPSRDRSSQNADIERGKQQLQEVLATDSDPIFTPPWNRCTEETADCLVKCGFRALSRESSATPFNVSGLAEIPITQDWFAHRKGIRFTLEDWGKMVAAQLSLAKPIGVMFHHAIMADREMQATDELLSTLAQHPAAKCRNMKLLIS